MLSIRGVSVWLVLLINCLQDFSDVPKQIIWLFLIISHSIECIPLIKQWQVSLFDYVCFNLHHAAGDSNPQNPQNFLHCRCSVVLQEDLALCKCIWGVKALFSHHWMLKYHIVLNKYTCLNKRSPGVPDNPHPDFDGIYPKNKWKWVENGWKTSLLFNWGSLVPPGRLSAHSEHLFSTIWYPLKCSKCTLRWIFQHVPYSRADTRTSSL